MPERMVYRDDLCREAPFTVRAADDTEGDDGLTLDGYGAVFNSVTVIDSWEGSFEELIAPGAFRKSLRERTPKLQFDHGYHPLIGSIPIGKITEIAEDARGLHVVARLHDNWLIEPIRDAIGEESIDGMSFRFSVVREEWRDANNKVIKADDVSKALWYPAALDYEVLAPLRRTLKEVKVSEVGPVVWPAYDDTSVGVRSKVTIDLGRLGDPDTRRTLARAVYLADAAERSTNRSTDAPPADQGRPDEHPAGAPAAPPVDRSSSDEHPSAEPRKPNPAKAAAVAFRGYTNRITEGI